MNISQRILVRKSNLLMVWLSILIKVLIWLLLLIVATKSSVVLLLVLTLIILALVAPNNLVVNILPPNNHIAINLVVYLLLLRVLILLKHGGSPDLIILQMLSTIDSLVLILHLLEVLRFHLVTVAYRVLRLSHLLHLGVDTVL